MILHPRRDAFTLGPPMPRRMPAPPSVQSAFRMAPEFWERAEALIDYVTSHRGYKATRSDVLREAIVRGLTLMERESDRDRA